MTKWTALVLGLTLASPLFAQDVQQVTSGTDADSHVGPIGPAGSPYVAINTASDPTPNDPGNADGSTEVCLLNTRTGTFTQATNWRGTTTLASAADQFLRDGAIVVESRADLTPGAPGHDAGILADYIYTPARGAAPASLVQVTPASGTFDVTFRGAYQNDRRLIFRSNGDLVVGGNTDASAELYVYDRDAKTFTQLTRGTGSTSFIGLCDHGRRAVVTSTSDLTGTGTNADGSVEMFLVNLRTPAFEQVTSGNATSMSSFVIDPAGRRIAFSTAGELGTVPGNADGSTEAYVYDIVTKELQQVTSSSDDSTIADFVAGTSLVVVSSDADFVPQTPTTPGNADHSTELFTFDLRTQAILQRTASLGDCTYRMPPRGRGRPALITSDGDLAPGAPGNFSGRKQIYQMQLGARLSPLVQLTAGDRDCTVGGVDDSGRVLAITSQSDLVLGQNGGHANQVFLANLYGPLSIRQLPSQTASTFKGFLHDGRSLLIESKGEFTPTAPRNADGSREVFRIFYR
jgi:Tol biopolymer transport system component